MTIPLLNEHTYMYIYWLIYHRCSCISTWIIINLCSKVPRLQNTKKSLKNNILSRSSDELWRFPTVFSSEIARRLGGFETSVGQTARSLVKKSYQILLLFTRVLYYWNRRWREFREESKHWDSQNFWVGESAVAYVCVGVHNINGAV